MRKILYGICGIGLGHMYRQLPILEALKTDHKIAIFAYGESLKFSENHFKDDANIKVIEVAVPYIVGNKHGLDFAASAAHKENKKDFTNINLKAFNKAKDYIGNPNFVITDYEPNAAQYAYMCGAPLYTIDQQSKYLIGNFPAELNGTYNLDEIQRLQLFFPKAEKRIVFSFFDVPHADENTLVLPPLLRPELQKAKHAPKAGKYVVYLSAQNGFSQSVADIADVLKDEAGEYIVYAKGAKPQKRANIDLRPHGDPRFISDLCSAEGLIATAGHSLLSEAVALGAPVYAMPIGLYEQQMNAYQIEHNGWGLNRPQLTKHGLAEFRNFCKNTKPTPQPKSELAKVLSLFVDNRAPAGL